MRIKFTEDVDVDIEDIPNTARGALGTRHAQSVPSFKVTGTQLAHDKEGKPILDGDGKPIEIPLGVAEVTSVEPTSKHFFRKRWAAELPDETAQAYIDAGQAVRVDKVHRVDGDEFESLDGMYTREDQEMFLAGVIIGYEKGSTRQEPKYIEGPNWDAWNQARRIEVKP